MLAVVLSQACGQPRPSSVLEFSPLPVPTPGLDVWPPVATRGEPTGVTLSYSQGELVLRNDSQSTWWMAPPSVLMWQGPPWSTSSDVPGGVREVKPGGEYRQVTSPVTTTVRYGAKMWQTSTPDSMRDTGWFVWIEVKP